ncbi:hypothetical protein [Glaciihabitans sp. dw_435]|uniref:hypothetical protein n=1 Tax=Glaciihabitans sp. dw_435 TaxID=2720081 RepID=UPI001BD5BA8F|nr:hypothetical protein [Glaciihabitans sp. dw_435]
MTDLSIQSIPARATADHTWLAGDSSAFDTAQSGTIQTASLTSGVHYDAVTKVIPAGLVVSKVGNYFVPFSGISEVQSVTITGAPTGGTFQLTYDGQTTAAIAYNATPAAVQASLEALSNINPGDIIVTGTAGTVYTIAFGGAFTGRNVPQLTSTPALTGGTTPAIAHATTTAGGSASGADVIERIVAYPIPLLQASGSLAPVVIFAGIVDAVVIPANLPVPAQRSINRFTPSNGKFAFIVA